jgi:subtilisin-like proprotein convertase family protein
LWTSLVVATVALGALAQAAAAETFTTTQNTDITIPTTPANVKGTPYPSKLDVQGGDGTIADVNVNLNISHTFPDDLDILLVSPSGDSEILLSDACGTADVSNLSITLDNSAGPLVSDAGPCGNGTFQPTNYEAPADVWPAPAPASPGTAQLGNFNGETPNGEWKLFVLDDADIDGGTVNSWSLTVTTNPALIAIPGTGTAGKANPYPSLKTFNTPAGKVISDVDLEINRLAHTFPEDIDMLLAGPRRGANVLAMSDACGSEDIPGDPNGINLPGFLWRFNDEAPVGLGSSHAQCEPSIVKPTNFGSGVTFPSPAPAPPFGSAMSVFDGLEGGDWRLFVNDAAGNDTGYITGWTLVMTTRDAADAGFAAASTRVEEGGNAVLEVKRTGQSNLGPATINVSTGGAASAGSDYTAPAGTLEFARGQASKTIEIPITNDKVGEATERFNVVLSSPRDDARLTGTTSTEVVIGPDNEIKFGKLKRNAKKGTAKLFVQVPGPGLLVLSGEQVKKVKKTVKKAGKVGLVVKPKGNAVGLLEEDGVAKVKAKVAFTPTDGSVFKKSKKVKLVLGS